MQLIQNRKPPGKYALSCSNVHQISLIVEKLRSAGIHKEIKECLNKFKPIYTRVRAADVTMKSQLKPGSAELMELVSLGVTVTECQNRVKRMELNLINEGKENSGVGGGGSGKKTLLSGILTPKQRELQEVTEMSREAGDRAKRVSLVTNECEATTNPLLNHSLVSRASLKMRLVSLGAVKKMVNNSDAAFRRMAMMGKFGKSSRAKEERAALFVQAVWNYKMMKTIGRKVKRIKVSERAKRASLLEDEHSHDEVREMATYIMAASTSKLTHSIRLARFTLVSLVLH